MPELPELAGFRGVDIAPFRQDMTAAERRRLLHEKFPSTAQLHWDKAFERDIELLGAVLKDILRMEMAPDQPGRRPNLEEDLARPTLDRLLGRDPTNHVYSLLPFPTTFGLLVGERSLRGMAAKVGIAKSRVQRLLSGKYAPTVHEMEHIARVFHKQPSYFLEYRVQAITASICGALEATPQTSIGVYERIWQSVG